MRILEPEFIERHLLPLVLAFALGVLLAVQQHNDAVARQRARADQAWVAANHYALMCGATASATAEEIAQ